MVCRYSCNSRVFCIILDFVIHFLPSSWVGVLIRSGRKIVGSLSPLSSHVVDSDWVSLAQAALIIQLTTILKDTIAFDYTKNKL